MNNRLTTQLYQGKEIWISDFSNLYPDQILELLNLASRKIVESGRDDLLILDIVKTR
ncbi:MAG: hypothetical protein RIM99_04930 [Cyclobacteriaceae bacterium]